MATSSCETQRSAPQTSRRGALGWPGLDGREAPDFTDRGFLSVQPRRPFIPNCTATRGKMGLPLDGRLAEKRRRQIGWRKMSKYIGKTGPVSGSGANVLRCAKKAVPRIATVTRAQRPENPRERQPFSLSRFLPTGSKTGSRGIATAQIAPLPSGQNAKTFEKLSHRSEISGGIKSHPCQPHNSATCFARGMLVDLPASHKCVPPSY